MNLLKMASCPSPGASIKHFRIEAPKFPSVIEELNRDPFIRSTHAYHNPGCRESYQPLYADDTVRCIGYCQFSFRVKNVPQDVRRVKL